MGTGPLGKTPPTGASVAVLPDVESLALAAATLIVAEARRAVRDTGRFTIALSGGSTPKPIYELLAAAPFAGLIPWEAVEVFWGDERCVDAGDPRSNELLARQALLDHVPVPVSQVHPMRCGAAGGEDDGAGAPGEAAARRTVGEAAARRAAGDYEALLRGMFGGVAAGAAPAAAPAAASVAGVSAGRPAPAGLDLVLLGIGDNGHTASLFPGAPELDEQQRWAVAALEDPGTAAATSGTGERLWRVTLTAPFINRAAVVLFVVSGASKSAVTKAAIEGRGDPQRLPALLVRPTPGRLWWLLDEAAAAEVRGSVAGTAGRTEAGPVPGAPGKRPVPAREDLVWRPAGEEIDSFEDLPGCTSGPAR
jgi:6-phosphogluconolactonase